jgi:hypothetical protein
MRAREARWFSSSRAALLTSLVLTVACGKSETTISSGQGGRDGTGGQVNSSGMLGSGGQVNALGGAPVLGGSRSDLGGALGMGGSQNGAGGSSNATPDAATTVPVGCVPDYSCNPTPPNTGDIYADCAARVNQFRACVCLPPLPRWTAGEACADQDSQYDSQQSVAHAGFQARICTSGNAQDECPGWKNATQVISQCLAQMFAEGPPPTATCTGSCYSAHGHYINMTGTNYKNGVACGFYTTSSGSMWAAQNFQ